MQETISRILAVLVIGGYFLYGLVQMFIALIAAIWPYIAAVALAVIVYKIRCRMTTAPIPSNAPPAPTPDPATAHMAAHPVGLPVNPAYRPQAPNAATTRRVGARALPPRPHR
jgi:hypothetical protein